MEVGWYADYTTIDNMTSHNIMSCQSISYIVQTLDEYLPIKTYLEILALRYIISDAAMDFIQ